MLDGVAQAVRVVVCGVDAPARGMQSALGSLKPPSKTLQVPQDADPSLLSPGPSLPLVPGAVVWSELDAVGDGVHLPVLHHQLHPQRGLPLPELALSHVLRGREAVSRATDPNPNKHPPLGKDTSKSRSDSSTGRSRHGEGGGLWPLISSTFWWQT